MFAKIGKAGKIRMGLSPWIGLAMLLVAVLSYGSNGLLKIYNLICHFFPTSS